MRNFMRTFVAVSLTSVCLLPALSAQEKSAAKPKPKNRNKQAWLSPADAPDFQLQGEYSGTVNTDNGEVKLGVQVIALGDGKFKSLAYLGGLPGDGYSPGDETFPGEGELSDGKVKLQGEQASATIGDGQGVIHDLNGTPIGKLQRVVRKSPTLGQKPPRDAVVLFDGKSADKFLNGKMTKDGLLQQGTKSKDTFGDFTLHFEFMLSYMPYARGQGRSNSGVYMQARHEVQVLDSFGLSGEHNECGGIYSVKKPDVNMCYPPLSWQTYDVEFTAAKFGADGKKAANARMTVRHNGVLIHDDVEVPKSTTASPLKEGTEKGPIYIQNHGNPVRFRNIWVVPKS